MNTKWVIQLKCLFLMLFCMLMIEDIYAKDCGVMGETYTIIETDFLEFIQSRIESMQQNGKWQQVQVNMQQHAIQYRDRPHAVKNISRAEEVKSWKFDPSIVLDHDLTTHEGKLIARAGTRINPLEYMSLSKTLIFFDGDDETQVKWVIELDKKLKGRDKLILVNGSVINQEKKFSQSIYFDQSGTLTLRFGITHVPATVTQNGLRLRITETRL